MAPSLSPSPSVSPWPVPSDDVAKAAPLGLGKSVWLQPCGQGKSQQFTWSYIQRTWAYKFAGTDFMCLYKSDLGAMVIVPCARLVAGHKHIHRYRTGVFTAENLGMGTRSGAHEARALVTMTTPARGGVLRNPPSNLQFKYDGKNRRIASVEKPELCLTVMRY